MHDPSTVAFEIRYPWRAYRSPRNDFERGYRESFITIWHDDPEKDGSDDSCGWFIRARHCDQAVLSRIVKRFSEDWDRTWQDELDVVVPEGEPPIKTGKLYYCGLFKPDGTPHLSVSAITLNLFFLAAFEVLGNRDAADNFMRKWLYDILRFAENPVDSMFDSITQKFGGEPRSERITKFACIIYPWILRELRPWYRHPRWHLWHWRIQIHPYQNLRRFLLTRCCKCGKGFRYGESPCTNYWDAPKKRFLRGEVGLYHSDCNNRKSSGAAQASAT